MIKVHQVKKKKEKKKKIEWCFWKNNFHNKVILMQNEYGLTNHFRLNVQENKQTN